MLAKKMMRDIFRHKAQFISIFIMAFLGVFVFTGISGEYIGLEVDSSNFYEETNLADGWIYSPYLNDMFLSQVWYLGATTEMERQMVVNSEGDFENEPEITLHFVENNTISKFYLIEGKPLDINDSNGVWLDKKFADAKNLKVGDKITFKPKKRNNYENNSNPNFDLSKKYTFPQNIPNNNALNNFNGKSNLLNNEENESGENLLLKKPKTMINREENMDIIDKNNQEDINDNGYNNNYENNENKNNNIKIVLSKKDDNLNIDKNIYNINKDAEKDSSISITVSELSESDLLKKKSKGKNLFKSFLYGLLFGSTASGIFWLKDEETRKNLYEKIKCINFNSIINFLKRIFSNPIEYFKKIFSDERMKDYLKVFGLTLGKFFDVFEGYNDWFRLIGIALSVYLCWLIIKSFIKALFKVWKYYN